MYKPGNLVTCVVSDERHITKGKVYRVLDPAYDFVSGEPLLRVQDDDDREGQYYESKFKPADPYSIPRFQPGDLVRCTNPGKQRITKNKVYQVLDPAYEEGQDGTAANHLLRLTNDEGVFDKFYQYRFTLVSVSTQVPGVGEVILVPRRK